MSSFFNMDSPIMRFLSRICDLMILNILCIICCLPVVTAGASITALYTITLKMVRGEESYIFKGFLKAFKENFKQGMVVVLIDAVLLVFGLNAILFYHSLYVSTGLSVNSQFLFYFSNSFPVCVQILKLLFIN